MTVVKQSGRPRSGNAVASEYYWQNIISVRNECLTTSLAIGQRAFSYLSPVVWNAIPPSVRDAPSVSTFKRRLRSFYFNSLLSKS